MSVRCSEIIEFIEKLAPVDLAEKWDNVGLMLGRRDKDIKRIFLCLDVTTGAVSEAVNRKADMIISHHPLIFHELKSIITDNPKGRAIYELIRNDINVYSAHTNLDVVDEGVNAALAAAIGLKQIRNLKKYKSRKVYYQDTQFCHVEEKEYGLGLIGSLKHEMDMTEFIEHIKSSLKARNVRVVGKSGKINNVAVFCGAFDGELDCLIEEKVDILVTGDLKYHTAQDAIEMGLCIVDAGHFSTEAVLIPGLRKLLSSKFPDLEIECYQLEADPFIFY